ncbi:MAG: TIGR02646 family protein [Chloroflexi bacterium]|nr:TIGR02646 family protein [Chloroflexota bacterium]
MIKLTRTSKPEKLSQKQASWTQDLCEVRENYYQALARFENGELETKPKRPRAKKSRYAHSQIKDQLKEIFGFKCAYCESPVAGSSHQHVEHFRPQSIYPKLAYEWGNLLLACGICNSDNKKAQFPLADGIQPSENKTDPCVMDNSDSNLLIDPCVDDPSEFFTFEDEFLVCIGKNIRATATKNVCNLNREYLLDQRRKYLAPITLAAKSYLYFTQCNDEQKRQEWHEKIKEVLKPDAMYVAMAKAKFESLGVDISLFEV